ncbi:MAG: cell envelope integrity protein CreD [bacterium]|nr:cell envelope integrity protein CreD [bacterium]
MKPDSVTLKLFIIAVIGGACLVASLLVFGLIEEREQRFADVKKEIAGSWGERQTLIGPMLIFERTVAVQSPSPAVTSQTQLQTFYLLPETLDIETELFDEVRSRGIFDTVVYTSKTKVSGAFSAKEIEKVRGTAAVGTFSVGITDTRGIEKQVELSWDKGVYSFSPGSKNTMLRSSGVHADVPLRGDSPLIPFEFEVRLKGSEGISFSPVGKETHISVSSGWLTPKFTGAFLPSTRNVTDSYFRAEWNISSFGQSFPHSWKDFEVDESLLSESAAGVELTDPIDIYDQLSRSIKYAVLFILITFAAFFVFEVLAGLRIHPVQYLLIGGSLALFYLLLLSLAEHIGFLASYILSTAMTALLITAYSARVLQSRRRSYPIFALLVVLYGYLYFVLQLEDYALLFGSLLLFVLLATVMYLTRNVNWFEPTSKKEV